jgi:hypothetical protein
MTPDPDTVFFLCKAGPEPFFLGLLLHLTGLTAPHSLAPSVPPNINPAVDPCLNCLDSESAPSFLFHSRSDIPSPHYSRKAVATSLSRREKGRSTLFATVSRGERHSATVVSPYAKHQHRPIPTRNLFPLPVRFSQELVSPPSCLLQALQPCRLGSFLRLLFLLRLLPVQSLQVEKLFSFILSHALKALLDEGHIPLMYQAGKARPECAGSPYWHQLPLWYCGSREVGDHVPAVGRPL